MIRILHLSDLHVAAPETKARLKRVIDSIPATDGLPIRQYLSFHYHDDLRLSALKSAILALDPAPDIICVTGDLTTYGDDASFDLVAQFLTDVRDRGNKKPAPLRVVAGNHDNFSHSWKALGAWIEARPWLVRRVAKWYLKDLLGALADLPEKGGQPLDSFSRFLQKYTISMEPLEVKDPSGRFEIAFFPLRTVNTNPIWMNQGRVFEEEWNRFKANVGPVRRRNQLRVVLAHHNPSSSPQVREQPVIAAYNATVDSAKMLAELQARGVDFFLCGHQHSRACYSLDFNDGVHGRVNVLHAPAAAVEDDDQCGFNVIDVLSRHEAWVHRAEYNSGEFALNDAKDQIFLEPEPVRDAVTRLAHAEFRHYSFRGEEAEKLWQQDCDKMIDVALHDIVILGQTLRGFSRPRVLKHVRKRLTNNSELKVCVLVMDPAVLAVEAAKHDDGGSLLMNSMRTNFVSEASQSLNRLKAFHGDLKKDHGAQVANRFRIGKVPGVVPFGVNLHAKFDDVNFLDGEMRVEVLPVGNWNEDEKAKLFLQQRCDEALYAFYFDFVKRIKDSAEWVS